MENTRQQRTDRYLLGEMSEREAIEFEVEYFADDRVFEEINDREDDLIDAYSRGEMFPAERQQFDRGYLTSTFRRQNLEFAQALAARVSGASATPVSSIPESPSAWNAAAIPRPSPGWVVRAAFAAAVVAMIVGMSWIMIVNQRLRHQLDQMRSQQAVLERTIEQLAQQSTPAIPKNTSDERQVSRLQPSSSEILSLILTPGLARSNGEAKQLVVPSKILLVHLDLYLERDDYTSYSAAVEVAAGGEVWRKSALASHSASKGSRVVALEIPSDLLRQGEYLVKLTTAGANHSIKEVADYHFKIVRH